MSLQILFLSRQLLFLQRHQQLRRHRQLLRLQQPLSKGLKKGHWKSLAKNQSYFYLIFFTDLLSTQRGFADCITPFQHKNVTNSLSLSASKIELEWFFDRWIKIVNKNVLNFQILIKQTSTTPSKPQPTENYKTEEAFTFSEERGKKNKNKNNLYGIDLVQIPTTKPPKFTTKIYSSHTGLMVQIIEEILILFFWKSWKNYFII